MSSLPSDLPLPVVQVAHLSSSAQSTIASTAREQALLFSMNNAIYTPPLASLTSSTPHSPPLTQCGLFAVAQDLCSIRTNQQHTNGTIYRGYLSTQASSSNLKQEFKIGLQDPVPQKRRQRSSKWKSLTLNTNTKFTRSHQELRQNPFLEATFAQVF